MCTQPKLIGLVGASGAGKSTLSKMLEERNYTRLAMAKPLKDMMSVLGLSKHDLYGPPAHRSAPSDFLCGKSPRHAMVTLGTEWGRELIGPDLWVNAIQEQIIGHRTKCATSRKKCTCAGIVIEDVRFPNEWDMIQRLGGVIWLVRRPEYEQHGTRIDYWAASKNKLVRAFGRALQPVARLFGFKPVHESELYWPNAPVEAEFWNTGDTAELEASLETHLQRLKPRNT